MGCGCNSGVSTQEKIGNNINYPVIPRIANCTITETTILKYKSMLECCKSTNTLSLINLTVIQCNSYLGYFQSALNYPDDYCYYYEKINNFTESILPLIINNVYNCTE